MATTTGQTKQLAFRLPHELVTWLETEAERVSRETDLSLSVSDVARRILTRAMRAASGPAVEIVAVEPTKAPPSKAPKTTKGPADERTVRAALVAELAKGERSQAQIAKVAGIDGGQVSRFKKTGKGIAGEKLVALAKALGV